ncbi:hypothetical protein [Micromonospora sp. NBC_01813]|uniref:hypothetical protein n=1 Tax=Micromonospora sp. NBC_01813 TaxID=2975988 RepID=UPI002DD9D61D|nr:hypothetical protein [Micromonospora sp. NBC_01813]WSA07470.1 hypothetical protein OG958_24945 [Micromonospora sp. NBC_01813]
MDLDLLGWLALGAGWLIAALIADALPAADDPARLRRRVTGLLTLVVVGLAGTVAMIGWGRAGTADAVAALAVAVLAVGPALAVAVLAVPRLRRLRAGSATFRTAPAAPTPPGLRADAAHPLLALPMQVAAVALLPVGVQAADIGPVLGAGTAGLVSTAAVVLLVATGVRHALRHSRLAERAVTGRVRWSPVRVGSYPR